ncbi:MAG: hypothetical protein LBP59_08320 [Planctomycetaceae bacterium]|jgi:hypothetical protein|nr:hypothetical protein [Planctomycetaceae bacterium]
MDTIFTLGDKLLTNIDLKYLKSIKHKLPHWNFYYLTCLAEVLCQIDNKGIQFESEELTLKYAINKAADLYNTVNISEVFENIKLV